MCKSVRGGGNGWWGATLFFVPLQNVCQHMRPGFGFSFGYIPAAMGLSTPPDLHFLGEKRVQQSRYVVGCSRTASAGAGAGSPRESKGGWRGAGAHSSLPASAPVGSFLDSSPLLGNPVHSACSMTPSDRGLGHLYLRGPALARRVGRQQPQPLPSLFFFFPFTSCVLRSASPSAVEVGGHLGARKGGCGCRNGSQYSSSLSNAQFPR